MMTLITVIKLLARFNLNPNKMHITISRSGSHVIGTTANLREGDILSVEQLLYGMMLPSGNDAAYTLAEYFG
jgi:D-alanyl-D-alanine carboxypeptidase